MVFMVIRKGVAIWVISAEDEVRSEAGEGDMVIVFQPPPVASPDPVAA